MSIDSIYAQQRIPASDGPYPLELESTGSSTFKVYRSKDGVDTLLPDGTISYYIAFEEDLDPIKRRGAVTLTLPLDEDEELLIVRETPIVNEYLAVAKQPFNTKAFEFALDKATLILQELEGNICACHEPDYPPDDPDIPYPPPEDPPTLDPDEYPECAPYACDAFRTEIANAEQFWPAESGYADGGSPTGSYMPSGNGGDPLPYFPAGINFVDNPVIPDGCYDSFQRDDGSWGTVGAKWPAVWNPSTSYTNTQNFGLLYADRGGAAVGVDRDMLLKTYSVTRNTGEGVGSYGAELKLSSYQTAEALAIRLTLRWHGGARNTDVLWSDLGLSPYDGNWFHVETTFIWSWSGGSYTATISAKVYLNGNLIIEDSEDRAGSSGPYTWVGGDVETLFVAGQSVDSYNNNMYYNHSDVEAMKTAYDRNDADYVIPDHCTIGG